MMVAWSISYMVASLLAFTCVGAHTCYFSQEPDQHIDGNYQWVLYQNPCFCAQFRLGGLNTIPSQRSDSPVGFFGSSLLRKHPDEIRDSVGCMTVSSTYNTTDSDAIDYPFQPFVSPLLIYIDVTVTDVRVYLTTMEMNTLRKTPPFMIEFAGDTVSIVKLQVGSPIYETLVSEVIPASARRHFWVYYAYDHTSAVIQVGLEQKIAEYIEYSPSQETTYLGIYSSKSAQWKVLHYQDHQN